ncbi:metalloregulator ArsR/SmtB family transcription factor [Marinobacterium weihaiense]|uniref:Metalloregulator ArsR/SmtB family transcription factor n=1 Tax=Marinobacterium weihaiense TaxID=2851016 RepID=A0ABS6M914_9GAMM|nr:metalloregulator ArsR/SmtB family transcription factor [Marinobacterium weihaiense]MBV0932768.1 metalloregulator ArsR/SmtB family transcription factor [Marinobacterium weihaiense]
MTAQDISALVLFKALADETRLHSVLLIQQAGELCVCELMMVLQQSQPKISRHLAQLRQQGILADRRQGQWVFYRLHPQLPGWIDNLLHHTREHSADVLQPLLVRLREMQARPSAPCSPTDKEAEA